MIKKKDREPTTAEKMKAARRPTWMVLILIAIVYIFLYRGFYGNGEQEDSGKAELAFSSGDVSVDEKSSAEGLAETVSTEVTETVSSEGSGTGIPEEASEVTDKAAAAEPVFYEFRNKDRFLSHFDKHGEEVGCKSAEEYLNRANEIINDPEALHKNEAEDGDDIYFREDTGEIVFVSLDGYIRTYFIATKSYYDRQ